MLKQTSSYRVLCQALVVIATITFQSIPAPRAGLVLAKAKGVEEKKAHSPRDQQVSATAARPQRTPKPAGAPIVNITATNRDTFPNNGDGMVHEGDTITYTVTVTNNGDTDALGVVYNDTIDGNTSTLVPSSPAISPIAFADTYSAIGNVRLDTSNIPGPTDDVRNNDTLNAGTLTGFGATQAAANGTAIGGTVTTTNGSTVVLSAGGTFTFNPAPGFTGADSFFYTLTNSVGPGTAKVTINISTPIWFINAAAAPGGDGRIASPFNCLVGAGCFDPVAADDPGDIIFLYSGAYSGGLTLLNNQIFVGQGASNSLQSIGTITVPAGSDSLPSTGGAAPIITTVAAATNGINLAVGANATLRGFNIGNTTGTKIASGANFGALTLGDNVAPDVALSGSGRALSLTSGAFGATSGLVGLTSTGSATQGVALSSVGGAVSFGSTTISGNTTQCVLVSASTASINFGNTSCTGGTDGISLQNNSSGTRTFGTLSVSGGSGNAFLHGVGGGNTTINGAASLSSTNNPVDIQNAVSATTINFAGGASATRTGAGGTGVNLVSNTGAIITFDSLVITTSNGTGLNATGGGTVNVTNGTGAINTVPQAAAAIIANGITLNANFLSVSSSGGANGISLTNVTGTSNFGTGSIAGATGAAFNVNGGSPTVTYSGSITQNNAQRVVDVQNTAGGSISFNTGAITGGASSTGININAANGNVSFANLTLGTSGSRMTNQAVTITGGTGTYGLGTVSIFTNNVAGVVATNADGTLNITSGTVDATAAVAGTNAPAINVDGPAGLTTLGMTLTKVSSNNSTNGILIQDTNGSLTITGTGSTGGTGGAISNITNRGASFINATSISLNNMTFSNVGTVNGADPTNSGSTCGDPNNGGNAGCNAGIHLQNITVGSTPTVGATLTNVDMNGGVQVGINGNNVTNFVLSNSNVINFGDQVREDGIKFLNMLGTSSISSSTISGNEAVQVHVENNTGTLGSLTVQTSTISNSVAPNGSHGLLFVNHGTANSKLVAQNMTFQNLFSNCLQADTDSSGTMELTQTASTFTSCGASGITLAQDGSGSYKFNIHDNGSAGSPTFLGGTSSHAININQAGNAPVSAVMEGAVTNNFIGNNSSSTSSTVGGSGINVLSIAPGTLTVLIQGNTTQGTGANGINVQMSEDINTNHKVNATILNNNATVTDVNSFDGIRVVAGALTNDAGTLCAEIANNNGSATAAGNDWTVRQRFATTFQLRGYTGGNTNTAQVQTHLDVIQGNNATGPGNDWFITTQAPGGGFVNTPGPGGQCTQPTLPTIAPPSDAGPSLQAASTTMPSREEVDRQLAQQAKPADPHQFSTWVAQANIIPALNDALLAAFGNTATNQLQNRQNETNRERFISSIVLQPIQSVSARNIESPYADRRGEVSRANEPGVFGSTSSKPYSNTLGEVRRNHAVKRSSVFAIKPISSLSGGTVTLNVGTLSAASSVTITYQVTVNSAAPAGATFVRDQGTVTGSNFSPVVTDDPDTAQPGDETRTPLLHPTAADGIVSGRILAEDGTPVAGTVVRLNGAQTRKTITDAEGNYHFDNVGTGGFYTVTPSRVNYNFNPFNRSFNQLGNRTEAAFTSLFTGDTANPLDTAEYFIRQQYVDILGREPDEGGFNYWSDRILDCGTDLLCVNARRREVAAAFFIEEEFQQTGSFIYDLYKGGLGRLPIFTEYAADRKQVVGGATLDSDKTAFAQAFVQRSEFMQKYQSNTTAESFVDALIANVQQVSGVDLSRQRESLVIRYNSGARQIESRSFVLRDVADSDALKQAEYNGAFVLTEYFGYLRRDPDTGGYAFWLDVLNNREAGNYRGMVCAFITSEEYQRRFSAIVSRTNANCGQ